MGIDNLPKAGAGFRVSGTPGSFKTKFRSATQYGELKNLRDNEAGIIKELEKRLPAIRTRKGLSWQERQSAYLNIVKNDKTLTANDKVEVKKLLEHYAKNSSPTARVQPFQKKKASSSSFFGIFGSGPKKEKSPVKPWLRAKDLSAQDALGLSSGNSGFAASGTTGPKNPANSASGNFASRPGTGGYALGGKQGGFSGSAKSNRPLRPII